MNANDGRQERAEIAHYLSAVLHAMPEAVFVHDIDGKIFDVNEKALQMSGCTREDVLIRSVRDFWDPDQPLIDRQPILWQKVMEGEDQLFGWKMRRLTDGSIFDVEISLTKLSLPEGALIFALARDITEHKRAEEEFEATRDFLLAILDNTYDAIYLHDPAGRIVQVNDRMLKSHGAKSREEVIGLRISDVSAPDSPFDELKQRWSKVLAGKNQFHEWMAKRLTDGSLFPVEVYLTKVSLKGRDYILANVRDITERKNIENLLIKEKKTLLSVLEDNPHGIVLINREERITYINPEFTRITGYSLDNLSSWSSWSTKTYGSEGLLKRVLDQARIQGGITKFSHKVLCKTGEHKHVECRITDLDDASLLVLTDITAQKRVEEELRAEKQKFEAVVENSPVGKAIIARNNGELCFKYTNPRFRDIFGYGPKELPEMQDWLDAVRNRQHDPKVDPSDNTMFDKVKPANWKAFGRKIESIDGKVKYVTFRSVRLGGGRILLSCEDVTLREEALERMKQHNLELEIMNGLISSVIRSLDLSKIFDAIRKVFGETLGVDAGAVFFYDSLSKTFTMKTNWGISDISEQEFGAFALYSYKKLRVDGEKAVAVTKNRTSFPRGTSGSLKEHGWRSYLCLSFFHNGELRGIVFLLDKDEGKFAEERFAFLWAVASQFGVAIQNARLYSEVEQSRAELKSLSLRLVNAQEAIRRYIARELHDEIGQVLTGLKLALEMHVESGGKTTSHLSEAMTTVNELQAFVRELSLDLRPALLDVLGLFQTLPWHFERYRKKTGINVYFQYGKVEDKRFPGETETAIYRIVQEALTNAARHAQVSEVTVRLWFEEGDLKVQIEDKGVGFDPESVFEKGNTSGLSGMRERAHLLGGRFTIETLPDGGTRLTAELPAE